MINIWPWTRCNIRPGCIWWQPHCFWPEYLWELLINAHCVGAVFGVGFLSMFSFTFIFVVVGEFQCFDDARFCINTHTHTRTIQTNKWPAKMPLTNHFSYCVCCLLCLCYLIVRFSVFGVKFLVCYSFFFSSFFFTPYFPFRRVCLIWFRLLYTLNIRILIDLSYPNIYTNKRFE